MRQFDVCRLKDGRDNLVVLLQNETVDEFATRVVAPLSDKPFRRLVQGVRVPVDFGKGPYVLQLDRMAAIATAVIGVTIGSVAAHERQIKKAIDLIFFGV